MPILETKTYRLKTLSPIHIRAGRDKEYGQGTIRLEPRDDSIYIIDTSALQRELFAFGGLNAVTIYADAFSDPRMDANIVTVLEQIGYDYKANIKKIAKGIVRIPSGNRFMQSGLGQYFIPGSSIKGAIKTAVLYHLLKNQTAFDLDRFVDQQIQAYQSLGDPNQLRLRRDRNRLKRRQNKFKEGFSARILRRFFESAQPRERTKNTRRKAERNGPFTDFFRAVKVKDGMIEEKSVDKKLLAKPIKTSGDSMILQNLEGTEIFLQFKNITGNLPLSSFVEIEAFDEVDGQVFVQKYRKVDRPVISSIEFYGVAVISLSGKSPVIKENTDDRIQCLQGETTIEISIDHEILSSFQRGGPKSSFTNLDELITICQDFATDQWKAEQEYLTNYVGSGGISLDRIKDFYKNHKGKATLRVGWGTGMLGTTVALLLEDQRRKELRNEVISHDQQNRSLPAPKSRRFVLENGEPIYPLGWIQLSEVKNG